MPAILGGASPCKLLPKGEKRGAFILGMTRRLNVKTSLGVGSLSTEVPMPTILGGPSPLPATPKGREKGTFIYGNDANAKTVSNLPLGFPERNDQSQQI